MISKIPNIVIKIIIVVPLFLFGSWLIKQVYFPQKDLSPKANLKKSGQEKLKISCVSVMAPGLFFVK